MKKRRLKKWVKTTIAVIIAYTICILLAYTVVKKVEFFNNNIETCGSNYCNK